MNLSKVGRSADKRFPPTPWGYTVLMRIEPAGRRHVLGRERLHRENKRDVSVEHDGGTRALYLLERDFYGFALEADIRARSTRYVDQPANSR